MRPGLYLGQRSNGNSYFFQHCITATYDHEYSPVLGTEVDAKDIQGWVLHELGTWVNYLSDMNSRLGEYLGTELGKLPWAGPR